MNELIILGNGFDLYCGLKSRFQDYHDYRQEKIANNNINETILDRILINNNKDKVKNWCDVENQMAPIL